MRALLLYMLLAAGAVHAQPAYPVKPVRIISAAAPGTPGDVVARIVAEPLAAQLGQMVLVENRPGAINTIGLSAVSRAEADGHTLGILGMPSTVAPSLLASMPYDTRRDLAPVRQLSWVANVLVVRPGTSFVAVRDLVAAAKAQPQLLTFASGGNGTPAHLAGVLFSTAAGLQMRHVPFKGALAGVAAVMGEQVDLMFAVAPSVIKQVQAGKLRALATPAPARLAAFPEVPTLSELGYAVDVRDWHGVVAPAGTAGAVVSRLASALGAALENEEIRARLAAVGLETAQSSPSQFGRHIDQELERWARVVREAGIRAD